MVKFFRCLRKAHWGDSTTVLPDTMRNRREVFHLAYQTGVGRVGGWGWRGSQLITKKRYSTVTCPEGYIGHHLALISLIPVKTKFFFSYHLSIQSTLSKRTHPKETQASESFDEQNNIPLTFSLPTNKLVVWIEMCGSTYWHMEYSEF